MRVMNQDRVKKYFNALQSAKNDIEQNTFVSNSWFLKFKIAGTTMGTLKNLGIVKNLGGHKVPFYEWNSKIPVTMLLAKKVILENNKQHIAYKDRKSNYKDAKSNTPQKPVAKPIVKRALKQILPIVDKTKIDRFTNQEPKHNQVGLIRRFLKWIY